MAYGDEDRNYLTGGFTDYSSVGHADLLQQWEAGVNILDTPLSASEKVMRHRLDQIYSSDSNTYQPPVSGGGGGSAGIASDSYIYQPPVSGVGGAGIGSTSGSGGGGVIMAVVAFGAVVCFPLAMLFAIREHFAKKQWIMLGIGASLLVTYIVNFPHEKRIDLDRLLVLHLVYLGVYLALLAGGLAANWLMKRSKLPSPTLWSRLVTVVLLLPALPLSMSLLGEVVPLEYHSPPILASASIVLLCIPGILILQRFRLRIHRKQRAVPWYASLLAVVVALPILFFGVALLVHTFNPQLNLVHLLQDWLQS